IVRRTDRANGKYSESEKQNRRVFLTNHAQLSELLGRYDDEVKSLTDLKTLLANNDGRIDRSIVDAYRAAKNPDKALAYCDQALKENPNSVPLLLARADLVAEKGRVEEAIKSLRDLTNGSAQDLEVFSVMANIYQRAKKNDEATTVAETMVRQFPDDVN